MSSTDHRTKGNEATKKGDYISAWKHYTEGLKETPKDPYLWCNRAFTCLKAGYPELSLHDSANSEVILAEYSEKDFDDDANLLKLKFKGKYRMAEAYSVLGIPKHAAIEYKACMELANKDPSMKAHTKADYNMWEKKKDSHYKTSLLHDQFIEACKIIEQKKRHGFYKFEEKYPWDEKYKERASEEMIKKLQKELDSASNNLLRIGKVKFGDSTQLGVFLKNSISKSRITLQENPFLPAHNYYVLRCDYCFHELKDPDVPEAFGAYKKKDPYFCPKKICKEVFCGKECYKLSRDLYHKALCGKDDEIKELVNFVHSDTIGVLQHLMLTFRVFAVAKIRDICPLDIEELKHLPRFAPAPTPYQGKMAYDPSFYDVYLKILHILEISRFDLRYDYWIFITVMNMVMPNAFPGPGTSSGMDTLVLYRLSSLINHDCAPNFIDAQYLSQDYDNSEGKIRDNVRMHCRINDSDNTYHPARIFFTPSRDVEKDEQAFKSYCDPKHGKIERHAGLGTTFGFICECQRCQYEPGEAMQDPINWHFHFAVLPSWVKTYKAYTN